MMRLPRRVWMRVDRCAAPSNWVSQKVSLRRLHGQCDELRALYARRDAVDKVVFASVLLDASLRWLENRRESTLQHLSLRLKSCPVRGPEKP